MEFFSVIIGAVFWPALLVFWLRFSDRRVSRRIRIGGVVLLIVLPLLGAASLAKFMFIDDPRLHMVP